MKGLLVKDFRLMMIQKNSFLIAFLISIGMSVFMDNLFALWFIPFIFSTFARTTISYDEFDNGNAFLFSLPITRKNYAIEKYLFGILLSVGSWIFSTFIVLSIVVIKDKNLMDTLIAALMILPFILINISIVIPFQLKFEREKGRIVMYITLGALFLLISLLVIISLKTADFFHIDLDSFISRLPILSIGIFIAVFIIITIVIILISMRIAISIVNKKEF